MSYGHVLHVSTRKMTKQGLNSHAVFKRCSSKPASSLPAYFQPLLGSQHFTSITFHIVSQLFALYPALMAAQELRIS